MNNIIDSSGRTTLCFPHLHIYIEPYSVCDCGEKIRENYNNFSLNWSNQETLEIQLLREIKGLLTELIMELRDERSIT